MKANSDYFMNDVREAKRLADKVNATEWVTRYITPRINRLGRVLDVGCGPGVLASAAARAHPELSLSGVDLCRERFSLNRDCLPINLKLSAGDAKSLPFGQGVFDLVFCRHLLEYLSAREQAVREMIRVCKPGGAVMLQDLDGQLLWHYPLDSELQTQINLVLNELARSGFDPYVGRKLYWLAKGAGLKEIEVTVESYHLFAGTIDDRNYSLWETKLDIVIPVAAKILGSHEAGKRLASRFLDYLRRDDTLTYSVLFTVVGKTPE